MNDEKYMRRALSLAARSEGLTRPNPPVGAVIVAGNTVVGKGRHVAAGSEHAEVAAIRDAGKRCSGATIYVSLEPCCTYGRTPPCTEAIIKAGIKRVVVATRDPNPKHSGRGFTFLKKAGVEVVEGVCAEQGARIIAPFAKWVTTGMPFVTLKLAMTLDGAIADLKGVSKWITSEKSRGVVQALRRKADVICVGAATARADNPSLLPRPALGRSPFRLIPDASGTLALSTHLKVLNDEFRDRTIIAVNRSCPDKRLMTLRKKGVRVLRARGKGAEVALPSVLDMLGKDGVLHVLFEGGGKIAESLLGSGLVDEFVFFVAPTIIGGEKSRRSFAGKNRLLKDAPRLTFSEIRKIGPDIMMRAVPEKR